MPIFESDSTILKLNMLKKAEGHNLAYLGHSSFAAN